MAVVSKRTMKRLAALCVVGALTANCGMSLTLAAGRPDAREIERARREVRLLDDIYKTAIVLITTHYVDET